jgi:hypothetical protein
VFFDLEAIGRINLAYAKVSLAIIILYTQTTKYRRVIFCRLVDYFKSYKKSFEISILIQRI